MAANNLLSAYRSELMAFAILAILLTHLNYNFGIFFIDRLALCCQGGVDAFSSFLVLDSTILPSKAHL